MEGEFALSVRYSTNSLEVANSLVSFLGPDSTKTRSSVTRNCGDVICRESLVSKRHLCLLFCTGDDP